MSTCPQSSMSLPGRIDSWSGPSGDQGAREFYLQARTKARIVTVALEKEQTALLAEKIDEVLDDLRSTDGNPFRVPD